MGSVIVLLPKDRACALARRRGAMSSDAADPRAGPHPRGSKDFVRRGHELSLWHGRSEAPSPLSLLSAFYSCFHVSINYYFICYFCFKSVTYTLCSFLKVKIYLFILKSWVRQESSVADCLLRAEVLC